MRTINISLDILQDVSLWCLQSLCCSFLKFPAAVTDQLQNKTKKIRFHGTYVLTVLLCSQNGPNTEQFTESMAAVGLLLLDTMRYHCTVNYGIQQHNSH